MYKYNSAICLIIRDENYYLQEWVRHHLSIGFEHIYIYDNNCKEPITETVRKKLKSFEREKVTVIDWCGKHEYAQDEAYAHCVSNFQNEAKWVAFIDTDEFIVLHDEISINEFLEDYESAGGIYMNWIMFNANGKEKMEYLPVMQRFTKTCTDFQHLGKLIVRADRVSKMYIHEARYITPEYVTMDEDKNTVIGKKHSYHVSKIQCNHYFTKSWEEWQRKIARGVADPYFGRTLREFFQYNPEMRHLDLGIDYMQEYERGV